MKIIVDNKYTFETDLKLKIGNKVELPTPSWLRDAVGATWKGIVTSVTSDYDGYCEKVIRKCR